MLGREWEEASVDAVLQEALFKTIGLKAPRLTGHVVAITWSTWSTATADIEVIENKTPRALALVEEKAGGVFSPCVLAGAGHAWR